MKSGFALSFLAAVALSTGAVADEVYSADTKTIIDSPNVTAPEVMTDEQLDAVVGAGLDTWILMFNNLSNALVVSDGNLNAGVSAIAPTGGINYAIDTIFSNPSP